MARAIQEFDLQKAFTIWYKGERRQDGTWKTIPAQRPEIVAWHTPNGGERRDAFEGLRLKQTGVEAGIHDYLFLSPRQFPDGQIFGLLYCLEFKKPGLYSSPEKGLSKAQWDMHTRLLAAGAVASATVDDLTEAKRIVTAWGLTVNA